MKKAARSLKITVALALLCAMSIIFGKYLAIRGGDVMRFSLENMPIIFAGIVFGPGAGALVGIVADLVGCMMVAYTVNPIVTFGAGAIGLVAGLLRPKMLNMDKGGALAIAICVGGGHLVGSLLIKTFGLSAYYDMPFIILMLWRLLNYLIVGALDFAVILLLMRNKGVRMQIAAIGGKKHDLRKGS